MEKERKTRVLTIIVLCIAVVGLSIGFAAFTRDLNIQFSESNVNVSGDLDIKFLASNDPDDTSTLINGRVEKWNCNSGITNVGMASPITITTSGTVISDVGAVFNEKDQATDYKFYIYNNSEYDAYLKSIDFLNYSDSGKNKVCTALDGTTQDMVDDACNDIGLVIVIDENRNNYIEASKDIVIYENNYSDFSSIRIAKGEMVLLALDVIYIGSCVNNNFFGINSEGALLPNGDFKVNFGDIKINFSSLEG